MNTNRASSDTGTKGIIGKKVVQQGQEVVQEKPCSWNVLRSSDRI